MDSKLLLAALVILAIVQLSVASDDDAWQKHIGKHKMKFKSDKENEFRKNLFKKRDDKIKAHNSVPGNQPLAHNKLSTMSDEEKSSLYGFIPSSIKLPKHKKVSLQQTRSLPASVDLRTDKCMSPIKDQGYCGSCWTFSATSTLEFNNCVKTGTLALLSEQQLVDCTGYNGCNGGDYNVAWNYIVGTGGHNKNPSYPYSATYGTCKFDSANVGATVSPRYAATSVPDANTAMTLLANRTVISAAIIGADSESFQYYSKGTVFKGPCGTAGHAINIVGYGTTSTGTNYWIVRNSWDVTWGDAGYAMFERGVNLCGIEDHMSTTTASTGDVVQPVVWTNATGGFSYSNCGFAAPLSSTDTMSSPSMTLDYCGNRCVATSTCNYFTFSGTTCTFLNFASSSVKPVAYVDSSQLCGSVVSRVSPIVWTTDGTIQTSSNCDFHLYSGSVSMATVPGTSTLQQCKTYCTTTYPSYCNFFKLSTAGVCTLNKSTTKPYPVFSSASSCGWVPTRF